MDENFAYIDTHFINIYILHMHASINIYVIHGIINLYTYIYIL